jgi:anthranilate phosphoribosyltransferase
MHEQLKPAVEQLLNGQDLTADETFHCIGAIMDGQCDVIDISAFLTAIAARGVVADELVGAARAMRQRAAKIACHRRPVLDTCGTGGDRLHTFNISTATALVAASCGVSVAKHGNRSVSSSSGSADVLEALGVNISLTPQQAGQCLEEVGIAFCFAPSIHGAMKHAAPVRRQLGFPTIFNLLGPLTNPAGAEFQIVGASTTERAELLATALSQLECERAFVVCGHNQLDEISLWGKTVVFEVSSGQVRSFEWCAADFGLPECQVSDLTVSSAADSAGVIKSILAGTDGPALNMVLANTAAALLVAGHATTLAEGVDAAKTATKSGAASDRLSRLCQRTHALAGG